MALMTAKEYIDSLRKLNTRVYMFGEKLDNWVDHPMIRPSINCVAMTYALAQDPQYEDLMTATSSLTGHKINRFTHLHQSSEDLVKKVKMQRLLGQKTASCFQCCVGMDAFNAVYHQHVRADVRAGYGLCGPPCNAVDTAEPADAPGDRVSGADGMALSTLPSGDRTPGNDSCHAAFAAWQLYLLPALPHTARKGECEGETFAGFPARVQSSARRRHFCVAKVSLQKRRDTHSCVSSFLERATRLELATSTLARSRSTR